LLLFFFYPQASDVGETYSLVPATVTGVSGVEPVLSVADRISEKICQIPMVLEHEI
jgi:hypothetical protein